MAFAPALEARGLTDVAKMSAPTFGIQGPESYANWLALLAGEPADGWTEFPLYSDSRFTGEIGKLGPYSILNTVPRDLVAGTTTVAAVLRVELHLVGDSVAPLKTDVSGYHGGNKHPVPVGHFFTET